MNEWIEQWIDPEEETEDEDRIEDQEAEGLTEAARRRKLSGEELSELIEVEEVRRLFHVVLWRSLTNTQNLS